MKTNDRSMLWLTRATAVLAFATAIGLPLATNTTGTGTAAPPTVATPHSWIADAFPVGQAGFARASTDSSLH